MNMNMNPLKELINILESDLDRIDNMDINYAEKYGRLKQAIKGRILRYSQILNNLQNKSYGTLQDIYGTNGVKNMEKDEIIEEINNLTTEDVEEIHEYCQTLLDARECDK